MKIQKLIPKKFALIGYPLEFSMSPGIYRSWFQRHAIAATYEILPLDEHEAKSFMENKLKIGQTQFDGINVTTPYKQKVVEFVTNMSEIAAKTGVINCIRREGEDLFADNTDVCGFIEMVKNIQFANRKVLVVGAGGAGVSVLYALKNHFKVDVDVMNRDTNRLGGGLLPITPELFPNYDIVINATTVPIFSMFQFQNTEQQLIDLNYKFTEEYKSIPNIIDGKVMLEKQAAKAFEFWFGFLPL